jgi:hypothetical protein
MPGSLSINRPRGLSKGPTKISKSVLPASQDLGTWGRLIFKALFYAYGLNGPPLTNCAKHGYTGQAGAGFYNSLGLRARLLCHLDQHSPSLSRIAHPP